MACRMLKRRRYCRPCAEHHTLRSAATIDPFSPYSGVISQFINGIEKNTTLKVFGNGNQTRDFICVTDVAGIIVDAIKNKIVSGAEIYNVCTGTETSINELIGILYEICKQTKNVEYYPQREGDILKSCGFNGRLIRDFGERKFIDLKSGLIRSRCPSGARPAD